MQVLWTQLIQRIATAAMVVPNAAGVTAVAQALGAMGLATTTFTLCGGWTDKFIRLPQSPQSLNDDDDNTNGNPLFVQLPTTLARTFFVPSLVEEVVWRVALQPPGTSWPHAMAVNAAFSAYHILGSATLAERFEGRQGARAVFADPAFLTLAFVLGNACSYAWVQSGYALWAPVVTHAVAVTVWLTVLGGNEALDTPGGLQTLSSSRP